MVTEKLGEELDQEALQAHSQSKTNSGNGNGKPGFTVSKTNSGDSSYSPIALPDQPLVTIGDNKSRVSVEWRDLWAHRSLLYFLVWRDVKVRYKQTALGMAWVGLQPLLMTIIFTVVFGALVKVPSKNVPYPLFAYTGLMLWSFFSGAVSTTGNSLVGNAHLITKVYFPRLIIPIATIIARLVDVGVGYSILIVLLLVFRITPSRGILVSPLLILLLAFLALGFGLFMSAVNVKYRDVGLALPVLIQLWMFSSPVFYSLDSVPQRWKSLFSLNPLVGILEGFRATIFGFPLNWPALLVSGGVTLLLLVYGTFIFIRREKTFADVI